MTVETDALAEAAQRFGEAVRAERTSTMDALETERKAAVQIIEALRGENARRLRSTNWRFVLGLLLGAAGGAVAVWYASQRSGEEFRLGLATSVNESGASLGERFRSALDAGRRAAVLREQELWNQYRKRQGESGKPRDDERFPY